MEKLLAYSKDVDLNIEKFLVQNIPIEFKEAMLYPIKTGGKRIRPTLVLLSAQAVGGDIASALPVAAAYEIAHNTTLIFDDIIDKGETRRGVPTLRKAFGELTSLLVGLKYREAVVRALEETPQFLRLIKVLSRTIDEILEGAMLEVLFERGIREDDPFINSKRRANISVEDYLYMVDKKTAALFRASCESGAIVGGGTEEEITALRNYGTNLGVMFQITDDYLDIYGDEELIGKSVGKDIMEHKIANIVVLLSMKEMDDESRNKFIRMISKQEVAKEEILEAIKIIKSTNAEKEVFETLNSYKVKLKETLKPLKQTEAKIILENIADFVVNRKF
ncbi:MAG: polyprenyl synthetase family protein [Thermoproteota archaeon]|nr:polyprenyl synthetase family protein [Candidatus Brockarchaeota archaeon]MBO3800856.1 polyprenyl synthetase family protein [Candidatus Brockarchaeota archaeon]